MAGPSTLYDKIWQAHLVSQQADGTCLIYIDRHLVHEVTSPQAFEGLRMAGRKVRRPEATLAVADHNVPTTPIAPKASKIRNSRMQVETLRRKLRGIRRRISSTMSRHPPGHCAYRRAGTGLHATRHDDCVRRQPYRHPWRIRRAGVRHRHVGSGTCAGHANADPGSPRKTCASRWMENYRQALRPRISCWRLSAKYRHRGRHRPCIEYAGEAIRALTMEGRMTVCNMTIEAGARAGLIAPDETTFAYLKGKPRAPKGGRGKRRSHTGARWSAMRARSLIVKSMLNAADIAPQVTWGTSPEDVLPITGKVPDPAVAKPDAARRASMLRALDYMGLTAGTKLTRCQNRPGVYRLLHQWPHRGFARRRQGCQRTQGRIPCGRHGGAGVGLVKEQAEA